MMSPSTSSHRSGRGSTAPVVAERVAGVAAERRHRELDVARPAVVVALDDVGGHDVVDPLRVALELGHDVEAVLERSRDGDRLGGRVSHGCILTDLLGLRGVLRLGAVGRILLGSLRRPPARPERAVGRAPQPGAAEGEHRHQHGERQGVQLVVTRGGDADAGRGQGQRHLGGQRPVEVELDRLRSGRAGQEEEAADADLVGAAALDGAPVGPQEQDAADGEEDQRGRR